MLAGINLKLGPGDFVGVMGTVGSGKSSLLQVITILALRLPLVNLNQQEVRQICGDPDMESATLLKRHGFRFRQLDLHKSRSKCSRGQTATIAIISSASSVLFLKRHIIFSLSLQAGTVRDNILFGQAYQ